MLHTDNFLSPTGTKASGGPATIATRVPTLQGVTAAILDNGKRNGDRFLAIVADLLTEEYGLGGVTVARKADLSKPAGPELLGELLERADVFITGIGDCGSCSACSVIDAITADTMGVPAAAVCTDQFQIGGAAVARLRGLPGYQFAVVQHPVGLLDKAGLENRAKAAVPQIVSILTAALQTVPGRLHSSRPRTSGQPGRPRIQAAPVPVGHHRACIFAHAVHTSLTDFIGGFGVMFDYRVSTPRRTVAALASFCAVGLVAACNSASSSSAAAAGSAVAAPAVSSSATSNAYPAPAGGNGGATAPGVTATEIHTATLYDGSGSASGLNPGMLRGVQAYYAYINSEGGVYGRKLVTSGLDSGYTPTSAASVCTQYAGSVFAFVGSLSVVDSGCLPPVQKAAVPYIGVKIDPAFSSYSGYRDFESGPPNTLAQGPFLYYAKSHPSVKKIAMIWVNDPGLAPYEKIWADGWKSVGIDVVYNVGVNPGTSNYTPYVVAAQNAGAQGIDTSTTDFSDTTLIAKTMAQQGWNPPLKVSSFAYDKDWLPETGSAGVGWLAYIGELPYLSPAELSAAPGGQLFSSWMGKEFPGVSPDVYAAFGWTDAALFVEGLVKAGPKLTPASLLSGIDSLASFSADGMIGTQDKPVGDHNVNACFIVLKDQAPTGVATRIYPKTGFDCTDQKLVTADGLVDSP